MSRAPKEVSDLGSEPSSHAGDRHARLAAVGAKHGAPDLSKRAFYRAVVDGRQKLVRWFSREEYGNPATREELLAGADVTLHDLVEDPGELWERNTPAAGYAARS